MKVEFLKNKLLEELKSQKNICFNNIIEKDNKIYIEKINNNFSSSKEVSEICNIQSILEKYKPYFNIEVSLDRIIIDLKK